MLHRIFTACVLGFALAAAGVAMAAPDAGAKARGEYSFFGHSVHSTIHSTRAAVTHYGDYLAHVQAATPAVAVDVDLARESSDAIGDSITRMRRHLTKMREHATELDDEEALALLDDVDHQLTEAATHHAALHAAHAGDTIDAKTARMHAEKVNAALEKARREHDELMAHLRETAD